jgi:hypothetical protein
MTQMKMQLIAATAAFALMGGAATAQDKTMSADHSMAQPAASDSMAQPATSAATDTSAMATDASAAATTTSTTTTDSSGASVTNSLVSNGPVPDTRENRAKYGQPMSHAGKMTKASGN